jgi:hypothetical protein
MMGGIWSGREKEKGGIGGKRKGKEGGKEGGEREGGST